MHKNLWILFGVALVSCSRSYMVKTDSNRIEVERVNVLAVQYHRPPYAPTNIQDRTEGNRDLICQSPSMLWAEILDRDEEVRTCLNSIQSGKAVYFYVPSVQPVLELDLEEEQQPECLKKVLSRIPLPRELYYLGEKVEMNEEVNVDSRPLEVPEQECYSSSFSLLTNRFLGVPNDSMKKKITIPFPVMDSIPNRQKLALWLTLNVFNLLKNDDRAGGKLLASPVPDDLCRKCFKNDALFEDKISGKINPTFWP